MTRLGVCLAALVQTLLLAQLSESKCELKAIFNFGDSNSDTGGFWAAFPAQTGPFGMTYFKRPTGRATDGRLIVDFLAQAIGIPFLSPYLQSIGSDFRHGANFATLASTVRYPQTSLYVSGLSPFSLGVQLRQLKDFKVRVDQLHSSSSGSGLPPRDIFGKSLYTFYIGQNDFTSELKDMWTGRVEKVMPDVVYEIANTVKEVYGIGGRTFWILNMAPVGCYPALLVQLRHNTSDLDKFRCLKPINNAVVRYNQMLKNKLAETRPSLPGASVIVVDVYSLMLKLFRYPRRYGLHYGVKACCGYGGGKYNFHKQVYCGNSKVINGKKITATACKNPCDYVSWDGIHATEVANKLITAVILNGSSFDPPFPMRRLCDLRPIG